MNGQEDNGNQGKTDTEEGAGYQAGCHGDCSGYSPDSQGYKECVMETFKEKRFVQCSFKGKFKWFEVLDPRWDWDNFDYRIAPYDYSQEQSGMMGEQKEIITRF